MKKSIRKFSLSTITLKDEKLLYEWANDKFVRRWSFNRELISSFEHKNWLKKSINNKKIFMWKLKYNSYLCGLIRIELIKKNFN